MQLEQRIKKELEENPVLEEGREETDSDTVPEEEVVAEEKDKDNEEFSIEDYLEDDEYPSYKTSTSNYSKDDKREEIPFSTGSTFHEFLEAQLGLRKLDEQQHALAEYLIGNIDEDGYLRREIESIVDDLAFSLNITTSEEELMELLRIIQDFDPIGVGARDLRECLLLQIRSKDQEHKEIATATKIIRHHFDEFTRKHYDKIKNKLGIDDEDLKLAIDEVLKLNPKPGSSFSDPLNKTSFTIVPDFLLEEDDGDFHISLNSRNSPELRLSKTYSDMLQSYVASKDNQSAEQKEAVTFVKQKLESAKWFIDAIRQRQNTLMVTMNAIVEYQYDYFKEGYAT